jgi:DNA modification methylase
LLEKTDDSCEVKGSDSSESKEKKIMDFSHSRIKGLITKPKIAGFGMNWQHCNNMIFVGLNDSYEQLYQAIRRCYRFGQTKKVTVHIISSNLEHNVLENLKNKEKKAQEMQTELVKFMKDFQTKAVNESIKQTLDYKENKHTTNDSILYLGDCVEVASQLKDQSIDYSIFSPPFASLYTYSNSERDLGNSKSYDQFFIHFKYLVLQLYRILRDGRNISVHCMNLPTSKTRDGYIGLRDFRGHIIKLFQDAGFIYHSEVTVWKNPVVAMQRTKALGLLWKQIKKDSSMSRQGIPDYVVTFRKPGINTKPVCHTPEQFPVDKWQQYASPCWNDINQSNTLNYRLAREKEDERHVAPLQLDLIERCIELWSIPTDVIFSPFAGVASEGYVSLIKGRKFIGAELKESYFNYAVKNLEYAELQEKHPFDVVFNKRFDMKKQIEDGKIPDSIDIDENQLYLLDS